VLTCWFVVEERKIYALAEGSERRLSHHSVNGRIAQPKDQIADDAKKP
jgi:hypothetical protein